MPDITLRNIIKAVLPYGLSYFWRKYGGRILFFFNRRIRGIEAPENSVLLVEAFESHGECLPGLAKYLRDLGYHVDVVMASSGGKIHDLRNEAGVFSRFEGNQEGMIRLFAFPPECVTPFLQSRAVSKYKHIVINTYHDYKFADVDLFKLKPVCMIHSNAYQNDDYAYTNKIISLVKINCVDRSSPVIVNAHYFGNFVPHKKSEVTELLIFGTISGGFEHKRNRNLIVKICEHLNRKNITNYRIKIAGDKSFDVPFEYRDNIRLMGFLPFSELYKEVEQADFIVSTIDPALEGYTNKASGAYQLSYGFLKPILIHKRFADVGNFTDKNSIVYDDICFAVEQAIQIDAEDYNAMIDELRILQQNIYNQSLYNLKAVLDSPIGNVGAA
jgi:hypothetical protein